MDAGVDSHVQAEGSVAEEVSINTVFDRLNSAALLAQALLPMDDQELLVFSEHKVLYNCLDVEVTTDQDAGVVDYWELVVLVLLFVQADERTFLAAWVDHGFLALVGVLAGEQHELHTLVMRQVVVAAAENVLLGRDIVALHQGHHRFGFV